MKKEGGERETKKYHSIDNAYPTIQWRLEAYQKIAGYSIEYDKCRVCIFFSHPEI